MCNKSILINVNNVTKRFKIYSDKPLTITERILKLRSKDYKEVNILENINFQVRKGEVVGLIGRNGSGKSTLLKLICKIIYPTTGSIEINGKIAGLLELGAGFHPDFTGRENIYINAAILGMSKKEVDEILNKIIDFSELYEYIDSPIRVYSSGMYLRLAFSIAINVKADILVIDEILAVGDSNFQKKCYKRLKELKEEGVTILLVTHDSSAVRSFCNRAVWIENHTIQADGEVNEVLNMYDTYMNSNEK